MTYLSRLNLLAIAVLSLVTTKSFADGDPTQSFAYKCLARNSAAWFDFGVSARDASSIVFENVTGEGKLSYKGQEQGSLDVYAGDITIPGGSRAVSVELEDRFFSGQRVAQGTANIGARGYTCTPLKTALRHATR